MKQIEKTINLPSRRELVIVLTNLQQEGLEHDQDGRNILKNQQVATISLDDWLIFEKNFKILGGIRPKAGMLLVLSPFDDYTYTEITEARTYISLEKMSSTIKLCQLLGASFVKINKIKIYDKETNKDISIDMKAKAAKAKGNLKSKESDIYNLRNSIQLDANFDGAKPNIETAQNYLKQNRLDSDMVLVRLVEMRDEIVENKNTLKSINQEICLTESLQNTFDFVGSLDFPVGLISTNYKKIVKEKIEFSSNMEIVF